MALLGILLYYAFIACGGGGSSDEGGNPPGDETAKWGSAVWDESKWNP